MYSTQPARNMTLHIMPPTSLNPSHPQFYNIIVISLTHHIPSKYSKYIPLTLSKEYNGATMKFKGLQNKGAFDENTMPTSIQNSKRDFSRASKEVEKSNAAEHLK